MISSHLFLLGSERTSNIRSPWVISPDLYFSYRNGSYLLREGFLHNDHSWLLLGVTKCGLADLLTKESRWSLPSFMLCAIMNFTLGKESCWLYWIGEFGYYGNSSIVLPSFDKEWPTITGNLKAPSGFEKREMILEKDHEQLPQTYMYFPFWVETRGTSRTGWIVVGSFVLCRGCEQSTCIRILGGLNRLDHPKPVTPVHAPISFRT